MHRGLRGLPANSRSRLAGRSSRPSPAGPSFPERARVPLTSPGRSSIPACRSLCRTQATATEDTRPRSGSTLGRLKRYAPCDSLSRLSKATSSSTRHSELRRSADRKGTSSSSAEFSGPTRQHRSIGGQKRGIRGARDAATEHGTAVTGTGSASCQMPSSSYRGGEFGYSSLVRIWGTCRATHPDGISGAVARIGVSPTR